MSEDLLGEKNGQEKEKQSEEQGEEFDEQDYERIEVRDWDEIAEDFMEFMSGTHSVTDNRGERFLLNLFHMMMAVATKGSYVVVYFFYYAYKFYRTVEDRDYMKEIMVKKEDLSDG